MKHTSHLATFEAEGLAALAEAGAPVPTVYEVDDHRLVMDDLDELAGGRAPTSADWAALGATLATVHRDVDDTHGWHRDNVIGTAAQPNEPRTADWPSFHWTCRIEPHLEVLPEPVAARLRRSRPDMAARLDHDAVPSLLHGDLWSGNVMHGRWFIDPAVCRGDRELDLAFLALFGGVPTTFAAGYDDSWPRDDGWHARQPILQLYHLLVHVRLFGTPYLPAVIARLDAQGW